MTPIVVITKLPKQLFKEGWYALVSLFNMASRTKHVHFDDAVQVKYIRFNREERAGPWMRMGIERRRREVMKFRSQIIELHLELQQWFTKGKKLKPISHE